MRTLIVGDIHLKAELILPIINKLIVEKRCERVIFVGDYVDEFEQTMNTPLYIKELNSLIKWKEEMETIGIEIIMLLGNHDAAYLINSPKMYSLQNREGFEKVSKKLFSLDLQIAFRLDDYLISHAGYCWGQEPEKWHFEKLGIKDIIGINVLEQHVGQVRGGQYWLGSPLWADYAELETYPNHHYLKQIVGHTPQLRINIDTTMIAVDTFSLKHLENEVAFHGNGDLLMYDDGKLEVVETEWNTKENREKLIKVLK
ncbi:phosphoesterase [Vagococcus lutrae]|uniref:metallophosphoesterase n=1 Tax=Vagococcus lutrae TaxID=81947 RepID=UPI0019267F9B|nr:metallophosphoesterase [Vagococcus lutrae]GEQ62011.1 phosphoesterase [Vagococcus lutrae]GEQ63942.1 phosphoesterase [Vagococcus lutrae]GEQ65833.1 phosphoesterase [Vagococcus lutrae]